MDDFNAEVQKHISAEVMGKLLPNKTTSEEAFLNLAVKQKLEVPTKEISFKNFGGMNCTLHINT